MKIKLLLLCTISLNYACTNKNRQIEYLDMKYIKTSFDISDYLLVKEIGNPDVGYKFLTTFNSTYNGIQGGVYAEMYGYKWDLDYSKFGITGKAKIKINTFASVKGELFHIVYAKNISAQQVDAPESATMVSPASQASHRPAR